MHPFQQNIRAWLSRVIPTYTANDCVELPLYLSTDIGLVRTENQDRVAALFTGRKSKNPILVVAVADGMGGMRDGGECSSLALASFFYALVQYRDRDIHERAIGAVAHANEQVFLAYGGEGGATLTSILFEAGRPPLVVHVGDSRIYTFDPKTRLRRHTIDDSLAEAVGGTGRELLQFIGMGATMRPSVGLLESDIGICTLTTDGIHGIDNTTLGRLLENATDYKEAGERLSEVARWCGGTDNATLATLNLEDVARRLEKYEGQGIQIWDAHSSLSILWLKDEPVVAQNEPIPSSAAPETSGAASLESRSPRKRRSAVSKRVRKPKKNDGYTQNVELDIDMQKADVEGVDGDNPK